MKVYKLITSLLLVALTVGLLTGCGSNTADSKKLSIAVLYDASINRQQEQYFDAIANAIISTEKIYPGKLEIDHIRIPINAESRTGFIESQLAIKKYAMVIDTDINYASNIEIVAAKNKDISFVVVDPSSTKIGTLANVAYLVFDDKQQGFIAGVMAALKRPGKIAHLDLCKNDINPGFDIGILAGIKAVNNGSTIEAVMVAPEMTERKDLPGTDLYDRTLSAANAVYSSGVGIIISDWEVDQLAVLTAARENKKLMIASDVALTQISSGASRDYLVESIVKNYELAITDIITKKLDGKFKGEKFMYNIDNNGINYEPAAADQTATQALINETKIYIDKLKSGAIKIN